MTYLSDFVDRIYKAPDDAQAGYRYTSVGFVLLHVTSVVQTDEDAIAYIEKVNKWYPKTRVMIVEKRDAGQQAWRMIHRVEEAVAGLAPVSGGGSPAEDPGEARTEDLRPVAVPTVPLVAPVVPPIPYPAD